VRRELRDLGRPVRLRPARARARTLVPVLTAVVVLAAVAAGAADDGDAPVGQLLTEARAEAAPAATVDPQPVPSEEPEPDVELPLLGDAGGLEVHVPAAHALLVSYHEASFPQALPIRPFGSLTANENSTRPMEHAPHPRGVEFHVQVSRGRANASTSAVDVVLPPGEEVRAPVAGTVAEVRPYRLYGRHDDVRLELRPDGSNLSVVLIHLEDVVVRAGDRVEVGDVLAGTARLFPFAAVVDRQTAPERHGHVHLEVKDPEPTPVP
jgi:biotin carboxyl carrier protein